MRERSGLAQLSISGRPVLRTLEGERERAVGEAVACPVGRAGAHLPDAVEHPDSGRADATADYYEGELD
jgi:hypothetical protein